MSFLSFDFSGDGNFHVLIMLRPDSSDDRREAHRLATYMAERAISLGGTCTGEHGIGVGKMSFLRKEMGEGTMTVMEDIKRALDPKIILNPGKMLSLNERKKL